MNAKIRENVGAHMQFVSTNVKKRESIGRLFDDRIDIGVCDPYKYVHLRGLPGAVN